MEETIDRTHRIRLIYLAGIVFGMVLAALAGALMTMNGPSPARASVNYSDVSNRDGFDDCYGSTGVIPVNSMATIWAQFPSDYEVGLYIGGADSGCPNTPGSAWVTQVAGQGWGLMPIWVGPQAPCLGDTVSLPTTATPGYLSTAEAMGWQNGNEAATAAAANGLGNVSGDSGDSMIVYDDIEHYNLTPSAGCQYDAVNQYVKGWSYQIGLRGYHSGVYSSPYDLNTYPGLSSVPDDVWGAEWNCNSPCYASVTPIRSVWVMTPMPTNIWSYDQRLKQYSSGGLTKQDWVYVNGTRVYVDGDCADGLVGVNYGNWKTPTKYNDADGYPGANDESGGGPSEDESSTTACP